MTGPDETDSRDPGADEIAQCAATVKAAIQQLCRLTITRPALSPADVSITLADLAAAVGAIPQAATQLSDILEHAKHERVLEMDTLTDTQDPGVALDTSRLHLDAAREHAVALHRSLDLAHNETAHIGERYQPIKPDRNIDHLDLARRAENLTPPRTGGCAGLGLDR